MLTIENLTVDHGAIRALHGVTFKIEKGQLAAVIGANGAGKTTLLRTLSGLNKASNGSAHWNDHNILHSKPESLVRHGISHVSEGKSVIPELTVAENLDLGALWRRNRKEAAKSKQDVVDLFPRLG
jgi:branched-chain amino acid transport system ATP-binding protein